MIAGINKSVFVYLWITVESLNIDCVCFLSNRVENINSNLVFYVTRLKVSVAVFLCICE